MMKFSILLCLIAISICSEMAVNREFVEYLKNTVSWEVTSYEENVFRGWTRDEFAASLGLLPLIDSDIEQHIADPDIELPPTLSWKSTCDHGPKDQGNFGSCWAFGSVGMLASRCCLHTEDHGWLSPQELVSCDRIDKGCNGGSPYYALRHVMENDGVVHDDCFPYVAKKVPCPNKCKDGKDWKDSHVCKCNKITECKGVNNMRSCLTTGPMTVGFGVCQSFINYKSGIYHCDCQGKFEGYHAVLLQGYSKTPECHWIVRNSWGPNWGDAGYFKIGCNECKIDGELGGANVMCNHVTNQ